MNLYQVGYYRLGRQGVDSGWTMVAPSDGMSKIAKDGFKGIAANMVELKNHEELSPINMGIFQHDRFFYLMHVNYNAAGDDARGVSYVHGYCFNIAEYYELCKNPAMLFGATSDNFDMEYNPELKAYPVKDKLQYMEMDAKEIRNKYGLDDESLRTLILSVIVAMEGYEKALCIKTSLPLEQHLQVYKDIMFLVLSAIPYHLRMKLTAFSGSGSNARVFMSNERKSTHYFDLDNKEFEADTSRLNTYRFILIYRSFLDDELKMKKVLSNINDFVNETFENPLKNIGCEQTEAGFNFFYRDSLNKDCVMPLLSSFLEFELKSTGKGYDYLEALLHVINSNNMRIGINEQSKLERYFIEKVSEGYRKEYSEYLIRDVLSRDKKEGYRIIYNYKEKSAVNYELLCNILRNVSKQYYEDYYMEMELPRQLSDLRRIERYIKQNKEKLTEKISRHILTILCDVARREMESADNNNKKEEILKTSVLALKVLPHIDILQKEDRERFLYFHFWNVFQVDSFQLLNLFGTDTFRIDKKSDYEENRLFDIAEKGYRGSKCDNAQKIVKLIRFMENPMKADNDLTMYEIIFTDKYFAFVDARRNIQKELRTNYQRLAGRETNIIFDIILPLFYNFEKNIFEIYKWIKVIFMNNGQSLFEPLQLERAIRRSCVFKDFKIRDLFVENLEIEIQEIKSRDDTEKYYMRRALKRCYDILCGKEVLSDIEMFELRQYKFTFHKMVIGILAVTACIMINKEIFYLAELSVPMSLVVLCIEAFLLLIALIVKVTMHQGIMYMFEDAGLYSIGKCVVYFLSIVAVAGLEIIAYMLYRNNVINAQIILALVGLLLVLSLTAAVYNKIMAEQ